MYFAFFRTLLLGRPAYEFWRSPFSSQVSDVENVITISPKKHYLIVTFMPFLYLNETFQLERNNYLFLFLFQNISQTNRQLKTKKSIFAMKKKKKKNSVG